MSLIKIQDAPKGYSLIVEGKVRSNDMLWNSHDGQWSHPTAADYAISDDHDVRFYYGTVCNHDCLAVPGAALRGCFSKSHAMGRHAAQRALAEIARLDRGQNNFRRACPAFWGSVFVHLERSSSTKASLWWY